MLAPNPYAAHLGSRDPFVVLAETIDALHQLTAGWSDADFERSHAPGKWRARQILVHLAQVEMVFGVRVRLALHGDAREVQPFDQGPWVQRESTTVSGRQALVAFLRLRPFNLALFESLTPAELAIETHHPDHGRVDIEWFVRTLAGHDLNHRKQLEQIAAR